MFIKKSKCNSLGQSLDYLVNGELPFGWIHHYKDYYKPKDGQLSSLAVKASKTTEKEDRIQALENLINYFYSYKSECSSLGECYEKYFDDMWMHCRNNQNSDFIFIQPYEEELKILKEGD